MYIHCIYFLPVRVAENFRARKSSKLMMLYADPVYAIVVGVSGDVATGNLVYYTDTGIVPALVIHVENN